MVKPQRWALFISGQGSNMSAVLDQRLNSGDVSLVVSSRENNFGLKRARRQGVATLSLGKTIDWDLLYTQLEQARITHIFLLGFMRVIPESFLQKWSKPIFNVHPSLLPSYTGLNSIQRAYDDQSDVGVTVHRVVPEVDAGSTVLQKCVVRASEVSNTTFEAVEQRVHFAEYHLVRKSMGRVSCWT